jgi:hypothetical protein
VHKRIPPCKLANNEKNSVGPASIDRYPTILRTEKMRGSIISKNCEPLGEVFPALTPGQEGNGGFARVSKSGKIRGRLLCLHAVDAL